MNLIPINYDATFFTLICYMYSSVLPPEGVTVIWGGGISRLTLPSQLVSLFSLCLDSLDLFGHPRTNHL